MTQNATNNTASSMDIGNINIEENTISSKEKNGSIILNPNDNGNVSIKGSPESTLWNITSEGTRTIPSQPKFSAYAPTNIYNTTGDNTLYTVVFGAKRFDTGDNFNPSTGIFTAPVEGYYFFTSTVAVSSLIKVSSINIRLIANNTTFIGSIFNGYADRSVSDQLTLTISCLAFMTPSSTAQVIIQGGKTTKTVSITGNPQFTFFHGFLAF